MNPTQWLWLKRLSELFAVTRVEPLRRAERIVVIQRNIILPIRLGVLAVVFYYLYLSPWFNDVVTTYSVLFETLQNIFAGYTIIVLAATILFLIARRFPPGAVKWVVFALGLCDSVFLGGVTILTGGFESPLYWVYPGVIVLNAISIPVEVPQIILNLIVSIQFLVAGLIEPTAKMELEPPATSLRKPVAQVTGADLPDPQAFVDRLAEHKDPLARVFWERLSTTMRNRILEAHTNVTMTAELRNELVEELNSAMRRTRSMVLLPQPGEASEVTPALQVLRIAVLALVTFSIYGLQVLVARRREALEEQMEFVARTERLHAAGRVAAQFAHQIKNPLAIINNVVFSLQRNAPTAAKQIEMIKEEVAKADRVITQIMGYAQLSEGRVEKLDVREELQRAMREVFPDGVHPGIHVQTRFDESFPVLLMQRSHLAETFSNLLLNAREAVDGAHGEIHVTARTMEDDSVEFTVRDNGPGIPPDKLERIFEAYYTTKPKGTGLGLAIVKHNVELYGGAIYVESVLGKGAQFRVVLPARTTASLPE